MRSGVWVGVVSLLSWLALIQPHAEAAKAKPRPTLEQVKQLIENKGYDFKSASTGPGAIVYEQFGSLHTYDLKTGQAKTVDVTKAVIDAL